MMVITMNSNVDQMIQLPIKKRKYAIMAYPSPIDLDQIRNSKLVPIKKRTYAIMACSKLKRRRTSVPKKAQTSSVVEQDGPNIIIRMIDHVKTIKGYTDDAITDAEIIMERVLNTTDIAGNQGRLAIPKGEILTPFLTAEEAEFLTRKVNAINMSTMDVKVIIGSDVYDMTLSRWNYKTGDGFKYVLKNKNSQWTKIKTDHNLKDNDKILVATFRYNNLLHFAILKHKLTRVFGNPLEEYLM